MAYTDINTPVVQKVTLPSGNEYYIADRQIRNVVEDLKEAIAAGVSFNIAWDGTSAPEVANIPSGVVVKYNGTDYTGTLTPAAATPGTFYLVKSATVTTESPSDKYDEYVVIKPDTTDSTTWYWEKIGDTQVDLTDVVTDVDIVKSSSSVIGSNATFTITQPTIALATDTTSGIGKVQVVTGITSASASGDSVTALTGLGTASTKSAIGANSTFTITQPTIALATDTTSGSGKVQVATGLETPTTESVLTGVEVTAQPTISLTANTSTATGRITYVQSQGTATTTKLSASASGDSVTALTGLGTPSTQTAVKSVSPTTKKLATTTVTGVQASTTTASKATAGTAQTTATGGGTASSTNTDWLKGVSVTNGSLVIGAATLNTQSTPQYTFADVTVPIKNASATTVASGSTTTTGSGADVVTDVSVGDTFNAVTGYASPTTDTVLGTASTITLASGSTGDVTVATGINAATTRYLSASASGTTVGGTGTADAITAISPTTTYIKGTASGANTTWNSKDAVTAVTGYASPTTDTVLGTGSTISVTPETTYVKATATGANTAWNNKDTKTVANYNDLDVSVTKGQ